MGNKNSGRRRDTSEFARRETISRAWEILDRYFKDKTVSDAQKVDTASKLVVKAMPTQITGDENAPLAIRWQS